MICLYILIILFKTFPNSLNYELMETLRTWYMNNSD